MTSNIKIPTVSKVREMSSMKGLVGRKVSKTVDFMGEKIKINKLMVSEVLDVQAKAADSEKLETNGLDLIKMVIKMSATEDAADLTDEDFANMPIDDLTKLSDEIMRYSGLLGREAGK
jgi:hypothetical protein